MNTSGKRLYLNSKGEVVGADDADKQRLVAAPGLQVPPEHVEAYNAYSASATAESAAAEPQPQAKAVSAAPQNKAVSAPQGSK
jgi:hypothetical protein